MIQRITVALVIQIHREQVCSAGLRSRDLLDAAVAAPFSGTVDREFYPTMASKAAKLLEGIARAQAFVDGNKRVAWLSMVAFPNVNGLTLEDTPAHEVEAAVIQSHTVGIEDLTRWVAARLNLLA